MREEELLTLEGVVEGIIFKNDSNGYTICEVDSESGLVTVVGVLPFLGEGETVKVMGQWVTHPTFGRQFKAEYFEKSLPATQGAILRYLSSRMIRGIGPVTAGRIVERFGTDTFDVIENHPEWLCDIKNISPKKAQEISEDFKAQSGMRSVMMFCSSFVGPSASVKIYKRWGAAAVDIIRQNPYILCGEIYGVGFDKADAMSASLGIKPDSHERLCAGIKYVLSHNSHSNGHVFLPQDKLTASAAALLGVSRDAVSRSLEAMIQTDLLVRIKLRGSQRGIHQKRIPRRKFLCGKAVRAGLRGQAGLRSVRGGNRRHYRRAGSRGRHEICLSPAKSH